MAYSRDMSKSYTGTVNKPIVFRNPGLAVSFANKSRAMCVVLGDCDTETGVGDYLVVTLADATRLERQGYEIL
jgi:hypothetical protein